MRALTKADDVDSDNRTQNEFHECQYTPRQLFHRGRERNWSTLESLRSYPRFPIVPRRRC